MPVNSRLVTTLLAFGLAVFTFTATLQAAASAVPHESIHELIEKASQRIAKDSANPALYLERAQLYRRHQDWPEARLDLQKASKLQSMSIALWLEEAHYYTARNQPLLALQRLDIVIPPDHVRRNTPFREATQAQLADAWQLRARIWRSFNQPQKAADAMQRVIDLVYKAEPDHFHFRAKALMELGSRGWIPALECAQQGISTLGACVSLELLAVDLECRLNRCDDAIQRLNRLGHNARRQESWLVQKGDVYWRCGRRAEALKQYRAALNAMQLLRPRTQNTPAVKKLRKHAQAQLQLLQG